MLGFLIRLLPFWVREPLLIAIGSVLGVRIFYLGVHDHDLVAAGLGVVFLVFTAIRVHGVIRALRERRNPSPAAPADGGAVEGAAKAPALVPAQAPSPAPAPAPAPIQAKVVPPPGPAPVQKEPNAWGQAFAALALFGALGGALWVAPHVMPAADDNTPQPASCSSGEREELPKAYKKTPRPVTGDELCEVLNRPDLAQLLGTPGETASTAFGTNSTAPLTDKKVAQPEAEVRFDTYTVHVSATYDKLTTAQYVKLMQYGNETGVKTLKVLGRPAVYSSDHTMKLEIDLGSTGSSGPVEQGPLARTLTVALAPDDRGGSYDFTVWSTSGALPQDSVLLGIAEKVLPAIPERSVR
ncbi:DUF6215 domain-containing protein [Streptomyces sp. NBC_00285]|uniref:DUF6215 domain-containing protein n=1 Tax=Streptomyces sp. NBC_00285 TaxID=2975700 RepID=UPI002E299491|nr:DUF6215 domain-containing protein [Streptomyces sp. NBC_00285]